MPDSFDFFGFLFTPAGAGARIQLDFIGFIADVFGLRHMYIYWACAVTLIALVIPVA